MLKFKLTHKKQVGRTRAEHDPFLDPLNNPQIHNADVAVDAAEDWLQLND